MNPSGPPPPPPYTEQPLPSQQGFYQPYPGYQQQQPGVYPGYPQQQPLQPGYGYPPAPHQQGAYPPGYPPQSHPGYPPHPPQHQQHVVPVVEQEKSSPAKDCAQTFCCCLAGYCIADALCHMLCCICDIFGAD